MGRPHTRDWIRWAGIFSIDMGEIEELKLLNDLVWQRRDLSRKQATYRRDSRAEDKNKGEMQLLC